MSMANAKTFVKKHAFELSCGGVAVLALAVCYFGIPFVWDGLPAVTTKLSEDAHNRVKDKKSVATILGEQVKLDGVRVGQLVEKDRTEITFTESLSNLRDSANKLMQDTKAEVLNQAAIGNRQRRVSVGNDGKVFALFWDEDLEYSLKIPPRERLLGSPGYLRASNTYPFVPKYKEAFTKMTSLLTGSQDQSAGIVPDFSTLDKAYLEEKRRLEEAEPKQFQVGGKAGTATPVAVDNAARDAYVRNSVMLLANKTSIYVDPRSAFQERPMGVSGAPSPNADDIWEGYVDIWLQRDVVDAIVKTNKESTRNAVGVGKSLIPRLIEIKVGPSTKQFFLPTAASSPMLGTGAAAVQGPPAAPAGLAKGPTGLFEYKPTKEEKGERLDNNQSATGRIGDDQYYVVMMYVNVVCDPSAVNKFVNNLYERNNGYTVVNRRDTTVDPYTAASNGYLYGNRQCVQLELLVECLMFRSWVDQVAPAPVQ